MRDNIDAGLTAATAEVVGILKLVAVKAILPIANVILIVLLIVCIVGTAKKKKMGEDFHDDLWRCILILIVFALTGSFNVWGWMMLGSGVAL